MPWYAQVPYNRFRRWNHDHMEAGAACVDIGCELNCIASEGLGSWVMELVPSDHRAFRRRVHGGITNRSILILVSKSGNDDLSPFFGIMITGCKAMD